MTQPIKQWLLSAACALAVCLPLGSQAQMPFFNRMMQNAEPTSSAPSNTAPASTAPANVALSERYFTNKEGNLIWDKATNLVWQRCSVGQTWSGTTCTGTPQRLFFDQAQNQARDGWRVPTLRELSGLVYCSSGKTQGKSDPEDGGPFLTSVCADVYSKPTINTTAFPATPVDWFWSSSPDKGHPDFAWYVDFGVGGVSSYGFRGIPGNSYSRSLKGSNGGIVRLVRASEVSGGEAALTFPFSMDESNRLVEARRQEEQRMADAKRQDAEAKRQEEERRAKAQRAAAERSLVALGPQALYLQAGKAQRNGSIEQGGVSFYASELYELIVEKFPKSEFAVKATDQLNALDRTERQGQAARQAAERQAEALRDADRKASNRAACFSEVNSCVARCRSLGMNYDSTQYCVNNCQKTCN